MPKVWRTPKDSINDVEISAVGLAGAGARGGIVISDAALVMPELQQRDDDGNVVTNKDGTPKVLTGSALTKAAEDFAKARGLEVVDASDTAIAKFANELGSAPAPEPAGQKAEEDYQRTYGGLDPVNDNPEAVAEGGSDVGQPAVAGSTKEE